MAKYIENERVYFYTADDGTDMVELHVDNMYQYNDDDLKNLPILGLYGGNTSVRLPPTKKATLCFGQDEAIFRSSQLNDSCWTINGQVPLQTKGLGVGVIVSAMISRELALVCKL